MIYKILSLALWLPALIGQRSVECQTPLGIPGHDIQDLFDPSFNTFGLKLAPKTDDQYLFRRHADLDPSSLPKIKTIKRKYRKPRVNAKKVQLDDKDFSHKKVKNVDLQPEQGTLRVRKSQAQTQKVPASSKIIKNRRKSRGRTVKRRKERPSNNETSKTVRETEIYPMFKSKIGKFPSKTPNRKLVDSRTNMKDSSHGGIKQKNRTISKVRKLQSRRKVGVNIYNGTSSAIDTQALRNPQITSRSRFVNKRRKARKEKVASDFGSKRKINSKRLTSRGNERRKVFKKDKSDTAEHKGYNISSEEDKSRNNKNITKPQKSLETLTKEQFKRVIKTAQKLNIKTGIKLSKPSDGEKELTLVSPKWSPDAGSLAYIKTKTIPGKRYNAQRINFSVMKGPYEDSFYRQLHNDYDAVSDILGKSAKNIVIPDMNSVLSKIMLDSDWEILRLR